MRGFTTYGIDSDIAKDCLKKVLGQLEQDFGVDLACYKHGEICAVVLRADWEGFGQHIPWRKKKRMLDSKKKELLQKKKELLHDMKFADERWKEVCRIIGDACVQINAGGMWEGNINSLHHSVLEAGWPSCAVARDIHAFELLLIESIRRGDNAHVLSAAGPVVLLESFFE